ncbi:MAG: ABC transporter substrate-binding protein [Phycisphaera sp.]|nr:ABC transporter substrate-binding protein [Phycisphaera sp.]
MPSQRTGIRPLILGLMAVIALAGCGGPGADRPPRPQIAVVPKGTSHEFWKAVHAGAVKAGRKYGVDIIWKGPAVEDDRSEQIKVVEQFTTRGVDGIVIAPLDDTALVRPLQEAADANIPVAIIDSGVNWDGGVTFASTDNYQGGVLAANEMGRLLSGRGRVAVLRYVEGSSSTTNREEGFIETIRERFPDIEIITDNLYGGATLEGCVKAAENLLDRFQEFDGAFAPCEPVTVAFMRTLDEAGRKSATRVVGFDASESLVTGLRSGKVDALVVQDPFRMGQSGVAAVVASWNGEAVPKRIDTGCGVITTANMDTPESKRLLSPPLAEYLD